MDVINVNNKKQYRTFLKASIYDDLVDAIIHFILSNYDKETEFFDISGFCNEKKYDMDTVISVLPEIQKELSRQGWKSCTAYGRTGLFIFENNPPPNCISDDNTFE